MKTFFAYIIIFLLGYTVFSQQQFHVFPNGNSDGKGSLLQPWDLQTALSQSSDVVNGGDIIWLHEGIYNGRFSSNLQSSIAKSYITVSAYKNDKVVLDGTINSNRSSVLEVKGGRVIFKNFEITCLGDFSRDTKTTDYQQVDGISHISGEDCQFINLKIHNNPGSGIGSWKHTGGTIIEDCMIYNNGYMSNVRGSGVGIYIQNQSDNIRLIRNNIIFNNFYKGIEVWSATSGTKIEFVKNVTLRGNVIFNNGSPGGVFRDNVIIASDDKEGINVAKNIKMTNNILYHNSDFYDKSNFGDGASLTLGLNPNAPIENVTIENNIIIGKNNALAILYAKSLTFKNNIAYCGYVHFYNSVLEHHSQWNFDNNNYYTRKSQAFRVSKHKDYTLQNWQTEFGLDAQSSWRQVSEFDMDNLLKVAKNALDNSYTVALFNKEGNDVTVDFLSEQIDEGTQYSIYDVENPDKVIAKGTVKTDKKVIFPMQLTEFEKPLHNTMAQKTPSNFGVFKIKFKSKEVEKPKKGFFKWLFNIF